MFCYALKSLKRQPGRYIRIVCILTFAMIIPILISIVGSSSQYGAKKQYQSLSRGMEFRIDQVSQGLKDRFEDDVRFETIAEPDSIYLRYIAEPPSNNQSGVEGYLSEASRVIHEILTEMNLSRLQVYDLTGIEKADSYTSSFMNQIHLLSFIIIVVSVLVFHAGYRAHIHSFDNEIISLYSIGCSWQKINVFFFWTLTVCFICAYSMAVLFSVTLMKILYTVYLNVQSSGYAWMLFHIDWTTILLFGVIWYPMLLIVYFIQMRLQYQTITGKKRVAYNKRRKMKSSGIENLPRELLSNRYGQIVHHGVFLAVLTVFVSVFIINYASINSESIGVKADGDFYISHHQIVAGQEIGISEEVRHTMETIPGVIVNYQKSISTTQYLASAPHHHSHYSVLESGKKEYLQTQILQDSSKQEMEANNEDGLIPVRINPYQPDSCWSVGDTIELYVYDPMSLVNRTIPAESMYDHPFLTEKICLKVCGYADEQYMDTPLRLFFQPNDYDTLTERNPAVSAIITLQDSTCDRNAVKAALSSVLEKYPNYEFTDLMEKEQIASRGSTGIYLLALCITCLFMIVLSLVIGILFAEYVIQQESANQLLFHLGLSVINLKHVYRAISDRAYIVTMLTGFIGASIASAVFFLDTGYKMVLTLPNILIYGMLFIVLFLVMRIPMQIELEKQFRGKGDSDHGA